MLNIILVLLLGKAEDMGTGKDEVIGYVVSFENDKEIGWLDKRLMWKNSIKPTDRGSEDGVVLDGKTLDLARAFIKAGKWGGTLPQTLHPGVCHEDCVSSVC